MSSRMLCERCVEVIIPGANAETEIVAGAEVARNATSADERRNFIMLSSERYEQDGLAEGVRESVAS